MRQFSMQRLLLFGATGLVGQQVLHLALAEPSINQIVAPTRRALPPDTKLLNPIVNFEMLPTSADWWLSDAVICALGTTIRQAGSQEQFRHIDHDYVMSIARLARQAGTPTFVLVSSLGANPTARQFYLRVKGELERDLTALDFPSLTIVRPSLLDDGPRPDKRPGEKLAIALAHLFNPLIPRRYRVISAANVARALLQAANNSIPGTRIIESDQLHNV